MNKSIKQKSAYIVHSMVGRDTSEDHGLVLRTILKFTHWLKVQFWLMKVNNMSEGEILSMYYLLTDRR